MPSRSSPLWHSTRVEVTIARRVGGCWWASCCLLSAVVAAQPFGPWASFDRQGSGYVDVDVAPAAELEAGFAVEAWVAVADDGICSSLAGTGYRSGWWVGVCGTTLRSFVGGVAGRRDGGRVEPGRWTHVAVSSDRLTRRHYVDGELVASFPEVPGAVIELGRLELGSDPDWPFEPAGGIAEVRVWSEARSLDQLRSGLVTSIDRPVPGLVGVWSGPQLATIVGGATSQPIGTLATTSLPTNGSCASTATTACFGDDRFGVEIEWRDFEGRTGAATVAEQSADSALWWFFEPTNWEMVTKVLDGCTVNGAHWVFAAAATTVHYRLQVVDHERGAQRIYFNPAGTAAVALTATSAFETCP